MFLWRQSGYFHDNLPIRTENEESYHTLGDWIKVCSQVVFQRFSKAAKIPALEPLHPEYPLDGADCGPIQPGRSPTAHSHPSSTRTPSRIANSRNFGGISEVHKDGYQNIEFIPT